MLFLYNRKTDKYFLCLYEKTPQENSRGLKYIIWFRSLHRLHFETHAFNYFQNSFYCVHGC